MLLALHFAYRKLGSNTCFRAKRGRVIRAYPVHCQSYGQANALTAVIEGNPDRTTVVRDGNSASNRRFGNEPDRHGVINNNVMGNEISPRHLRVFIAVVETGGITKAAKRLLRDPSAVTRSIRELEANLSAPLFDRQVSGMLPTVFGDAAFVRAKRISNEFSLARQELV